MVSTTRAGSTRAALSAAAQEYILTFRSHPDAEGVTPSLVAKDLEVSKQAAAEMFKRLADDKLIAGCTGHARLWKLTAAGEAAGTSLPVDASTNTSSVMSRCPARTSTQQWMRCP